MKTLAHFTISRYKYKNGTVVPNRIRWQRHLAAPSIVVRIPCRPVLIVVMVELVQPLLIQHLVTSSYAVLPRTPAVQIGVFHIFTL